MNAFQADNRTHRKHFAVYELSAASRLGFARSWVFLVLGVDGVERCSSGVECQLKTDIVDICLDCQPHVINTALDTDQTVQ